uniref:Secreted protein n=1 Tax=Panstrongylus lignarius TaxID=156445 RepID=A0A224XTV1_9HEMI
MVDYHFQSLFWILFSYIFFFEVRAQIVIGDCRPHHSSHIRFSAIPSFCIMFTTTFISVPSYANISYIVLDSVCVLQRTEMYTYFRIDLLHYLKPIVSALALRIKNGPGLPVL